MTPAPSVCEFTSVGTLGGHEYFVFDCPKTWDEAKALCEQNGGYLVTISSQAENDFVAGHVTSACWIGLNDKAVEGTWVWSNGENAAYRNWKSGQPDSNGDEDAASMNPGSQANDPGKWHDQSTGAGFIFVMEKGDPVCEFTSVGTLGGHEYFVFDCPKTWDEAKALCEQNGGYLVTISSQAENDFVAGHVTSACWIGLNDKAVEETWVWSNGENAAYRNWKSGQPDSNGDEDAASMNPGSQANDPGKWHDQSTGAGFIFVMEKGDPVCEFTSVGTLGGHEYFVFDCPKTWDEAKALCEQNGGYLVTISSQAENDFVAGHVTSACWIGLNDKAVEGTWVWSNGENAAYRNWKSGQPDSNGDEDAASMNPGSQANDPGKWHDQSTGAGFIFVMEKGDAACPGVYSSPLVTRTDNGAEVILRMELNGYPSHGFSDNAADIEYPGNSHGWQFEVPADIDISTLQGAHFRASLVLDTGENGSSLDDYSLRVATNGEEVFNGLAGLPYGLPGCFCPWTNWVQRDYPVSTLLRTSTITISHTSSLVPCNRFWLAVDWLELHLPKGDPVCEFTSVGTLGGHEYFVFDCPKTWDEAKALCEQNGGYLVTISSQAENDFVAGHVTSACWIGLNDKAVEGTWVWSNGENAAYRNWKSGQPDSNGDEDAASMNPGSQANDPGRWHDQSTGAGFIFVMETAQSLSARSPGDPLSVTR